ncbi:MAG: 2,3-bisphosphoglycerate-independent phosphoglycerate mutase, partial [Clostridia bacterium]
MSAYEVCKKACDTIKSGKYDVMILNFANCDMVGHTGNFAATKISMEALDLCLERILKAVDESNGIAIITADHGNADEMYELDKSGAAKLNKNGAPKAKTSHTLNPVPCYIYDNFYSDKYTLVDGKYGLANIAATVVTLLGEDAPDFWQNSMIKR